MKKVDKMDEFTKYAMHEAGMESPSKNFVTTIMAKVKEEQQFVATPAALISVKMWWFIGVVFTVLSIYLVLNWQDQILTNYSHVFDDYLIGLEFINSRFQGIQFSNTFVWSFLLFGILLFIQAVIIRNYSNKRITD